MMNLKWVMVVGDYESAKEASEKVRNDPNAHVGGPGWVNEGA